MWDDMRILGFLAMDFEPTFQGSRDGFKFGTGMESNQQISRLDGVSYTEKGSETMVLPLQTKLQGSFIYLDAANKVPTRLRCGPKG